MAHIQPDQIKFAPVSLAYCYRRTDPKVSTQIVHIPAQVFAQSDIYFHRPATTITIIDHFWDLATNFPALTKS